MYYPTDFEWFMTGVATGTVFWTVIYPAITGILADWFLDE